MKNRWLGSIIGIAVAAALPTDSAENHSYSTAFLRGAGLACSGKFERGIIALTECIKQHQNLREAYYWRAHCEFELHKYAAAAGDCTEALKIDRNYIRALRTRAEANANLNKWADTLADCNHVLAQFPTDPPALDGKEKALMHLGKSAEARKVMEIDPSIICMKDPDYLRGTMFSKAADPNMAQAAVFLTRYLARVPNDKNALYLRGRAYEGLGKFDKALTDLSQSTRLKPDDYNTYRAIAQIDEHLLRYKDALVHWNQCIELSPGRDDPYLGRASCYRKLNQVDKAIGDYSTLLILQPEDDEALRLRATAYFDTGKLDKALADCDRLVKSDPSQGSSYLLRSKIYEKLGKRALAKQDADAASKLQHEGVDR